MKTPDPVPFHRADIGDEGVEEELDPFETPAHA